MNTFCDQYAVFWDVAPCRSCVNRRFGGTQPPAHAGSSLVDFPNLKMEAIHWEDQGVGRWTILKWILEGQDGMVWIG
jgi:hypothetical protein